ncbi:MAG TPA: 16S rRNA (adenine(1518)-N(6)/adenine(1519)-N(6))-dimethyltransferase RsmA [Solirubrobacterales bacterium]
MRLGQNFLADRNLLEAIVRAARVGEEDVVLEVGGGEGVLTAELAPRVRKLWVVELDEGLRPQLEGLAAQHPQIELVWGDAMRVDLAGLDPAPVAMVSNLPYSVATPVLLRTIAEVPELERWLVMVQLEIADRLRARPGSKTYGAPSVLVQLSCVVELERKVDPAVFKPRPRVHSALVRMERTAPWPGEGVARLVRAAFAHRRKALARSVANAGVASRERVQAALAAMGLDTGVRAEELAPAQFVALAGELGV